VADINTLVDIMAQLRDPESGCPWDIQQDMRSLLKYTLEEVYEVVDAIERDDTQQTVEELGDLLFQIVFYARVGKDNGCFDLQQIIDTVAAKLVTRHPHVFSVEDTSSSRDLHSIHAVWEQHKEQERSNKGMDGVLSDIPLALPALPRATKIQSRLSRIGFDWSEPRAVLAQLRGEIEELEQAMDAGDHAAIGDELGDVLFSCVNMARHLQHDAETCLRASNQKVMQRIAWMEMTLKEREQPISAQSLDTLEELWQQAKQSLAQPE
jgi:ATP diphosphatase